MKLADSLYRIGNDIVATYLVDTPAGVTLIDAGLSGHWKELLAELASINRTLEDVKGLVLTHGDSDHVGFAERLRRQNNIPVYIHPDDAERAMGGPKPSNGKQSFKVGSLLGFLAYTARKGGLRTKWLTQVEYAQDGDILDLPGNPRIIGLPGHSPGSIAIHIPVVDAVFVGDALTTRNVLTGNVGLQPAPFTDVPQQAVASLRKLVDVEAKWVLPGHGAPWNGGVNAAITALQP